MQPSRRPSSPLPFSFPITSYEEQDTVHFEKVFRPVKQPHRELVIKPLTEEYLVPCARLQAECFCRSNGVYVHFKVPEDLYMEKLGIPLVQKTIREQLGVICVDKDTDEVLAQVLNLDFSSEKTDPYYVKKDPLLDRRGRYHEVIRRGIHKYMSAFPRGKYETIHVRAVATSTKAEGMGLFSELLMFAITEHPIIKKCKLLFSEATHPASGYAMIKNGFNTMWQMEWKELAKVPGYEEFAGIGDLEIPKGKIQLNGVQFNVLDRSGLILRPGL